MGLKKYFTFSNIVKTIFVWSVIIFVITYFQKDRLPDPKYIDSSLQNNPIQGEEGVPEAFAVKRGDIEYEITPLFSYELWGMIVAVNDNESLFSRFKDIDPLNTKDLCVIWGNNVKTDLYLNFSFKSIEFVCEYLTDSQEAFIEFRHDQLSNNHLLAEEKEIYKKVRDARPGDQIYFKGYLSSYTASENGEEKLFRGTSTVRDDTGNGACETVYLTDFEFVKKSSRFGDLLSTISFYVGILSIIAIIIDFFVSLNRRLEPEKIVNDTKEEEKKKIKDSLPPSVTRDQE